MRKVLLSLNLIIIINFIHIYDVYSQSKKPVISFETLSHDFGTFKEENGAVKYSFKFTNKGNAPLLITDVKASCGCTTPDWTKSPVQPGQTGFVSASYDPANRPGNFDKTITVTSNANQVVLRITGEVIAKIKTNDDLYPAKFDNIRLETNNLAFAKILNTEIKQDSISVLNISNENVRLSFGKVPSHITLKTVPEIIKPKDKGYIIATYNANKSKYWGYKTDNVNLLINNKSNSSNVLTISATIEEDFSKLTKEQLANAPVIQFEKKDYDFGTIKQGEIKSFEFKFTNTGKTDLNIREIKGSSGFNVKSSDNIIQPGKSSSIKVTFNSANKKDKQSKIITVITNDPKNSKIYLKINGFIDAGNKK